MIKYIKKAHTRLSELKAGISKNSAAWLGQPDSSASVQAEIDALTTLDDEIELLKDTLSQKLTQARTLTAQKNIIVKNIEKRAESIHSTEPLKLIDYKITPPGKRKPRPLPAKAVIKKITDDDDGTGFKIFIKGQGRTVETWEVQRGEITTAGTTGTVTILQPPYPFLRTTTKLVFTDNDVEPGVRYFYRVRGINNKGAGEWSEPVSAVQ